MLNSVTPFLYFTIIQSGNCAWANHRPWDAPALPIPNLVFKSALPKPFGELKAFKGMSHLISLQGPAKISLSLLQTPAFQFVWFCCALGTRTCINKNSLSEIWLAILYRGIMPKKYILMVMSRTSYIIFQTLCRMKMLAPMFYNVEEFLRWQPQSGKPLLDETPSVTAQDMCPWRWTWSWIVECESGRGLGLMKFIDEVGIDCNAEAGRAGLVRGIALGDGGKGQKSF